MEIYIGLIISFCLLIFGVIKNIFIGYMLIICWALFILIALKKGYKFKEVMKMSYDGGKKTLVVIKILLLIGMVISIWMASGTIPTIVYYCIKYIRPDMFILSAFLICCITSFLTGTSSGTVSTVGIPLIILARSGNVNIGMAAGAVMAGAFFGDRCSPMSSSAALVANITETDIFKNIKNMLYSAVIPLSLSLIFYFLLSRYQPLKALNNNLSKELLNTFKIGIVMLIPALIILILTLFKVKVSKSMILSIIAAFVLAIIFQNHSIKDAVYYMTFGFKLESSNPLRGIIKGGGIISMLRTCVVLFTSCALAGIFEGIKMFDRLKGMLLEKQLIQDKLFGATVIISIITAVFGCSQATAVVMTNEIMKDSYGSENKYELALAIENSAIIISALIPWNIAALMCTTVLNVNMASYVPFAFYLYMIPYTYFLHLKYVSRVKLRGKTKTNTIH